MNAHVIINFSSPVAFYTNESVRENLIDLAYKRLVEVPQISGRVEIGKATESSSSLIKVDNGDGAMTMLFAEYPFFRQAQIFYGGILRFSGEIQRIKIKNVIEIGIE